jgi:hypothetical protein
VSLLDGNSEFVYLVRAEFSEQGEEDAWNAWYDGKHIPDLLTVPGFLSATRYRERGPKRRYLAAYEISSPDVFQDPRYAEVTGWGEWEPYIVEWRRGVFKLVDDLEQDTG